MNIRPSFRCRYRPRDTPLYNSRMIPRPEPLCGLNDTVVFLVAQFCLLMTSLAINC